MPLGGETCSALVDVRGDRERELEEVPAEGEVLLLVEDVRDPAEGAVPHAGATPGSRPGH